MRRVSVFTGFLLVLLLGFTACLGNSDGYGETITPGVEGAIYDGIILFIEEPESDITLVQVELRDFYREMQVGVRLVFLNNESPRFSRGNGYVTLFVEVGDRVYEGDLVATLSFEGDLYLPRRTAQANLARFDRDFSQARFEREVQLENARQRMNNAQGQDFTAAYLAVRLLETDMEIFMRDRLRAREPLYEALAEIDQIIAGENMYAPINGIVSRTMNDGDFMRQPVSVMTIVDDTDFIFQIHIEPGEGLPPFVHMDSILNFGEVITLSSEVFTMDEYGVRTPLLVFDVVNYTDFLARGEPRRGRPPVIGFAKPVDMDAFMEAVHEVADNLVMLPFAPEFEGTKRFYFESDAMVIPRSALHEGIGNRHYVLVYMDGIFHKRYLQLGIMQFHYVQVLSGLSHDSLVVVPR